MNGESNKPFEKTVKNSFKSMPSALDRNRAAESENAFSVEAQKNFGSNERGSEDIIDMMEKGAF